MGDVEKILSLLGRGVTREEIAELEGIQVESLNQRLRRAGFTWDDLLKTYVPSAKPQGQHIVDGKPLPSRIVHAISLLRKITSDPRDVARLSHYKDEQEMAVDMKNHGLIWSSEAHNYVPKESIDSQWIQHDGLSSGLVRQSIIDSSAEKVEGLLDITTIPRYRTRARKAPKTMSMSINLQQLLYHVSSECNISQSEILEVAFIEFCLKYGYKKEIMTLFG